MKKCKHLFVFICVLTVVICTVSCKSSKNKNKAITDNSVTIRLRSLTDIKIQNPTATVTLYGYDETIANNKASVIAKKTISLTAVPLDILMAIPKKPESMIQPQPTKAAYYLEFYCDANTNGIRDKGDLFLDNTKGLPKVDIDNKESQVFFVTQIK